MATEHQKLAVAGVIVLAAAVVVLLRADQGGEVIKPSTESLALRVNAGDTDAIHALPSGREEAIPVVTRLVRDPRPDVRVAAVAALSRFDREKIDQGAVAEALSQDSHAAVRAAAAKTLGTIHAWDAMPQLVAALRDPDETVRRRAGKAVERILGVGYGYDATAHPKQRERVVRQIEKEWPNYLESHLAYMDRLRARGDL